MTVEELIRRLEKYDMQLRVVCLGEYEMEDVAGMHTDKLYKGYSAKDFPALKFDEIALVLEI